MRAGRTEIVEEVIVESAMTTEGGDWVDLRVVIPSTSAKGYANPCNDRDALKRVTELPAKGSKHRCKFVRGRLKNGRDGQPLSGEWDSDYYWELAEWDSDAPITPQGTPSGSWASPTDDGLKGIRWGASLKNAATLLSSEASGIFTEGDMDTVRDVIYNLACLFYALSVQGPPDPSAELETATGWIDPRGDRTPEDPPRLQVQAEAIAKELTAHTGTVTINLDDLPEDLRQMVQAQHGD